MSEPFVPREYQRTAIRHVIANHGTAILASPGTGKTSIALSAFRILRQCRPGFRALVIGPLPAVLITWPEEVAKWDQFSGFTFSILHGPEKLKRARAAELPDLCFLNAENIEWLFDAVVRERDVFPFDLLIIDESTLFKTWKTKRTKILKKFRDCFDRVICLTGTPIPNGLIDLFSQIYLADGGRTLGPYITPFKNRFFHSGGFRNKELIPNGDAEPAILNAIARTVVRIDRADCFEMPDLNEVVVPVILPPAVMKIYKSFEKKLFAELDGDEITVPNASANYNICRQIAAGGLYDPTDADNPDRKIYDVHSAKIDAVERLSDELYKAPILLAYQFRFNADQFRKSRIRGRVRLLDDGPRKSASLLKAKRDFLSGDIPILAVHPATMSHSLNLHTGPGRSVVWLSPTNNLEHFIQFNERIYRPGVRSAVSVYILIAVGTIEEAVFESLKSKDSEQKGLLNAIKRYRKKNSTGKP